MSRHPLPHAFLRCSNSRIGRALRVIAWVAACAVTPAFAQTFDPTFHPLPDDEVWFVANHPDGGSLIGGFFRKIDGLNLNGFTRLDASGHVVPSFEGLVFHSSGWSVSVAPDDKLVIGGDITKVNGATYQGVTRLTADGALDTSFANPMVAGRVYATWIQGDGKILVAGSFYDAAGTKRARLVRLNANGTLDTAFNPVVDREVNTMTVQPDGKILIGGYFGKVNGVDVNHIARLNVDGTLDASFRPNPNHYVWAIAVQPDGKILIGGAFQRLGTSNFGRVARLNPDGSRDISFVDPGFNGGEVYGLTVQADGRILAAGGFTTAAGLPRHSLARLNADGSLDRSFGDVDADWTIYGMSLQADGRLLLDGRFTTVAGNPSSYVARLIMPDAAVASLAVDHDGARITWLRSGTSPEFAAPPVAWRSTNGGATWTRLGAMARIAGGWRLSGVTPIYRQNLRIRVDGITLNGRGNNSQGRVRRESNHFFDDTIFKNGFD